MRSQKVSPFDTRLSHACHDLGIPTFVILKMREPATRAEVAAGSRLWWSLPCVEGRGYVHSEPSAFWHMHVQIVNQSRN